LIAGNVADSIIFSSNDTIGAGVTFSNHNWDMTPLPFYDIEIYNNSLNHLITSGSDGNLMVADGSDNTKYRKYRTHNVDKINAIRLNYPGSNTGIAIADSGKIFKIVLDVTNKEFSFTSIYSGTTYPLNDIAFRSPIDSVYIAGDHGTVLCLKDLNSTTALTLSAPGNRNYNGIIYYGGKALAVGSHSDMRNYIGTSGIKLRPVFTDELKDVNFRDANEGFTIGINGISRHTTDAGLTWWVILPEYLSGVLPDYNTVWTTGPNQMLIGGNNGYLTQIGTTGLTQISSPGTNDWNDIKFGKDSIGYVVGTGGTTGYANKLTYHSLSNDVSAFFIVIYTILC